MRQALFLSLLALAACAAPQGIRTTGDLRLQAVQPDVVAGCAVRAAQSSWATASGIRWAQWWGARLLGWRPRRPSCAYRASHVYPVLRRMP